jgi:hypothetical protein
MMKLGLRTLAVLALAATMLAATPAVAQSSKKLGGIGSPQGTACSSSGGTMNGTMCDMPGGRSCEAMTYARSGECFDATGNLVPETVMEEEEPDVGSNDGSDQSGGEGGDTQSE